jgi:hypothetical protein
MESYGFEQPNTILIGSQFKTYDLFGSAPKAPEAFRAPGFETQGEILNALALAPFITPEFRAQQDEAVAGLQQQLAAIDAQRQTATGTQATLLNRQAHDLTQALTQAQGLQSQLSLAQGFGGERPSFTPGQEIAGQIAPTTTAATQPGFTQRTPFQFSTQFDPRTAVGQAFAPQAQALQAQVARTGELQRENILEDLNKRGLLTAGATTEALSRQREVEQFNLGQALAPLAAQQAQQQLGAAQFGAGLGFQQQQAQAAEIFRQQGATDAQAQFLAQQALAQQQQQFGQQLAGRQQALGEFGLQQQLQRQPQEDLFRLFTLSTGATPGSPGSTGFFPGLIGGVGGGLAQAGGAALFCLPKGTEIEGEGLTTVKIEDIKLGDKVEGGIVIGLTKVPREAEHKFSNHKFQLENGEFVDILMTRGHPYHDDLFSIEDGIDHESEHTYDILTTTGYYFVKGIKIASTIGGVYCG